MTQFDFDLFVIGAGSGGVRAARMAATYGARVAIAEESRVGGTCVIRGCIPKKLMVYAAHFAEDFEDAANFGWRLGRAPTFDWATLVANRDAEIDRLNAIYKRNLAAAGVRLFETRAVLVDPHTLDVGGERITSETILIATGSWPLLPDLPGIEHAITSNEVFHLERLPRRMTIVGGGYIAIEFAGIFNGLGTEVTQLYRGEQILRGFDREARDVLAEEMRKKGVDLRVDARVTAIEPAAGGYRLRLDDGGQVDADVVMYATGRAPNTAGLGLERAGVVLATNGAVAVDDDARTSVPNIHAVGDCTDRICLTPVAIREGAAVAASLYNDTPQTVDYRDVPHAVFGQPALATVGLSEDIARAELGLVDVYKARFRPLKHTVSGRDETAFMKMVVERASDRVVGAVMVGAEAAEIIQGVAIAVKSGATKAQFDATTAIHPTTAEEFVLMREPAPQPAVVAAE